MIYLQTQKEQNAIQNLYDIDQEESKYSFINPIDFDQYKQNDPQIKKSMIKKQNIEIIYKPVNQSKKDPVKMTNVELCKFHNQFIFGYQLYQYKLNEQKHKKNINNINASKNQIEVNKQKTIKIEQKLQNIKSPIKQKIQMPQTQQYEKKHFIKKKISIGRSMKSIGKINLISKNYPSYQQMSRTDLSKNQLKINEISNISQNQKNHNESLKRVQSALNLDEVQNAYEINQEKEGGKEIQRYQSLLKLIRHENNENIKNYIYQIKHQQQKSSKLFKSLFLDQKVNAPNNYKRTIINK